MWFSISHSICPAIFLISLIRCCKVVADVRPSYVLVITVTVGLSLVSLFVRLIGLQIFYPGVWIGLK